MKPGSETEDRPATPPSFERRVVLEWPRLAGLVLMMAVPVLALAQLLGDRVQRREVRKGDWILGADVPACARDGDPLHITVNLSRRSVPRAEPMADVRISADYLGSFTEVRRKPFNFIQGEESGGADAVAPVVIELTPDRSGWARGRLGVTTETGERLELELTTFVFP